MLVQVGNHLYTLSEGRVLQIPAGQTLRVQYSFIYRVVEPTSIPVWGSLYRYTAGVLDRSAKAQTKMSLRLNRQRVADLPGIYRYCYRSRHR